MASQHRTVVRKFVNAVALTGGAAAIATGMALAGAGTASAENQQNVVRDGNKFSPGDTVASQAFVGDAGTNFLTQLGTAISNGQIQVGTAGTNAISQTGTAIQNGQIQVGTAGTNAITQLGTAGNGFLNGVGNLFNRG